MTRELVAGDRVRFVMAKPFGPIEGTVIETHADIETDVDDVLGASTIIVWDTGMITTLPQAARGILELVEGVAS